MTARATPSIAWTIVIPVKSLTAAKTRLAPEHSPAERAMLARAFALDTVDVARTVAAVDRVVVVSDEPVIERELRGVPGVEVVPEVGARGLAAAITHGIAVARTSRPLPLPPPHLPPSRAVTAGIPAAEGTVIARDRADGSKGADAAVGVLLGDVPALRAEELARALEVAARHPLAFVPDAEGTGTTLATARAGVPFDAHFGQDSAARHAAAGFADLVAEHPGRIGPGLRRDVDTAAELHEAVALGVGPRTSAVLRTLPDLADGPAPRHPLDPSIAPDGADRKAAS